MRLAIMQPYFMPYIGYFQLINAVNEFVIYDNIEYTKKGWINRNRILVNGKETLITIPLKKDSDYLFVSQRYLSDIWVTERTRILNKIVEGYRKAPFFSIVYPILEKCFLFDDHNLFGFIYFTLCQVLNYLGIRTPIVISSTILIDHELKAEEKVIKICKNRNADSYLNPIGGMELYSKEYFRDKGIDLFFLKSEDITYSQFNDKFIPSLSIMDVIMFNSKDRVMELINLHSII